MLRKSSVIITLASLIALAACAKAPTVSQVATDVEATAAAVSAVVNLLPTAGLSAAEVTVITAYANRIAADAQAVAASPVGATPALPATVAQLNADLATMVSVAQEGNAKNVASIMAAINLAVAAGNAVAADVQAQ